MKHNTASIPPEIGTGKLIDINEDCPGYWDLNIHLPVLAKFGKPGQFVMIRSWQNLDPTLARPFDIMDTDPQAGTFRVMIKTLGRGTELLSKVKKGDPVQVVGPLGKSITDFDCKSIGLLVRGVGSAAVVFLAKEAYNRGIKVYTFHSASTSSRLVCRDYLKKYSTEHIIITDDASEGERYKDATEAVSKFLEGKSLDRIYTCGSKRFARFVKTMEDQKGIKGFLFLEGFMACGIGDCHGCAVKKDGEEGYYLVCQDGPVFPAGKVVIE